MTVPLGRHHNTEALLWHGEQNSWMPVPDEAVAPIDVVMQKLSLAGRLTVLTLLAVEGLELQSFSYHPAFFLVAGPVFFLSLPYFFQSKHRGGE
eukprot:1160839-Pelagomonas_calceolata.AAC.8